MGVVGGARIAGRMFHGVAVAGPDLPAVQFGTEDGQPDEFEVVEFGAFAGGDAGAERLGNRLEKHINKSPVRIGSVQIDVCV